MKKIKNVLYCFLFLSVFSSCSDFLDRTPLDFISPDNYLTNENQAEKLLNGVYQCLMANKKLTVGQSVDDKSGGTGFRRWIAVGV